MYPRAFAYYRAASLKEAAGMLAELGPEARPLAGGQSLIPLMKLRLSSPAALVDLGHIPGLDYIAVGNEFLQLGPLVRHADIEHSPALNQVPLLHDCAAGIADVQVRNWGTVVGSIAEADPAGDWAAVLLALGADVHCMSKAGERSLPLTGFITDAFATALQPGELISSLRVRVPGPGSGGCYVAYKRCAPVYASASVAVQLRVEDGICREAAVTLGAVGLMPVIAAEAAGALRGNQLTPKTAERAAEAAGAAADPASDNRGSGEYKKALIRKLLVEAVEVAARRARGETVEVSHHYA
ncbi:MAG: xanthine dehydrogenase family protein subunit M [Acidobacteria bacterium]|nr:xanthine dehydrogenase family protein subunit M [Acidobacteriota bacterium]